MNAEGLVYLTDRDTGQVMAHRVTTRVRGDETVISIEDVEGLVEGVEFRDRDPAVARHRLREWLAHLNVAAQRQRVPEARRRHERRRATIGRMEGACPDCGNTGWVTDRDGNGGECRRCLT